MVEVFGVEVMVNVFVKLDIVVFIVKRNFLSVRNWIIVELIINLLLVIVIVILYILMECVDVEIPSMDLNVKIMINKRHVKI